MPTDIFCIFNIIYIVESKGQTRLRQRAGASVPARLSRSMAIGLANDPSIEATEFINKMFNFNVLFKFLHVTYSN